MRIALDTMRIAPKYTPESQHCRMLMTLRGIDEHELARRCGCVVGTIRNLLANSQPYPSIQVKVQEVLGARIWDFSTTKDKTTSRNMKTTEVQIPEGYIESLPEKFQPFAIPFHALKARKEKLDADIAQNRPKHAEAEAERNTLLNSGPPDETNVARLSEAEIRTVLFANHQTKLDEAALTLNKEAGTLAAGLSREIRKIAAEYQLAARQQFFATVESLVIPGQNLAQTLVWLKTPAERAAEVLGMEANSFHDGLKCPFEAWENLMEVWQEFTESIAPAVLA